MLQPRERTALDRQRAACKAKSPHIEIWLGDSHWEFEGRNVEHVSSLERGGSKAGMRPWDIRGKLGTVRVLPIITDLEF